MQDPRNSPISAHGLPSENLSRDLTFQMGGTILNSLLVSTCYLPDTMLVVRI